MNNFAEGAHSTQWIAIKHLSVVWSSAQREFNERHADKIAQSFDPDLFDTLVVTLPNGNGIYHVVDGQHRWAAIRSLFGEDEKVPCRIVDAKDPARAAIIFDKINTGRRLPSGIEKFRVRVTAGYEAESQIHKVVTWLGCRIEASDGANSIRATAALMNIYNSFGLEVLKEALMTIRGTWKDDKGALEGPIIEGYGSLIGEHRGHLDWARLREKTASSYTPGRLLGAAKADKETLGGRISDGVRRILIRNYDQGLRSGKLGSR